METLLQDFGSGSEDWRRARGLLSSDWCHWRSGLAPSPRSSASSTPFASAVADLDPSSSSWRSGSAARAIPCAHISYPNYVDFPRSQPSPVGSVCRTYRAHEPEPRRQQSASLGLPGVGQLLRRSGGSSDQGPDFRTRRRPNPAVAPGGSNQPRLLAAALRRRSGPGRHRSAPQWSPVQDHRHRARRFYRYRNHLHAGDLDSHEHAGMDRARR